MASITEISVEHIHNAYESIRGNIAVEAFYAVVTGFMAVTLIHRLYTVYREVQSNEDGTPTMKDYMNLVWQYVFCIAAVALFPVLLEALETVFGKLMDDLQAGFGGKVYDVADLFQKPIIAQFEKQFSDMSVMDVAGVLLNPVGSSFDYLLAYVAGVIAAPFYMYAQTLFIVGRYHVPAPAGTYIPCGDSLFLQREYPDVFPYVVQEPAGLLSDGTGLHPCQQVFGRHRLRVCHEHLVECRPAGVVFPCVETVPAGDCERQDP